MRSYATNSPHAAGRILALTMVVDGHLAHSELVALDSTRVLQYVSLDHDAFQQLLQELCEDMLVGATRGIIEIDAKLIDELLVEIEDPDLRRKLLQAMWNIADADGWLANGEAVLLTRAGVMWGAETGFCTRGLLPA